MPHDISHLPPSPVWVIPTDPADPRDAVREWLGHIAAGCIGNNPPPPPACLERSREILARRLATEAQFAALAGSTRA